jgi:tripartite-type tricarboxylate transporter receptor subunit TctC
MSPPSRKPASPASMWCPGLDCSCRPEPPQIVKQINDDVNALLKTKDVMDAFAAQGAEPFATTPDGFGGVLKRDIDKWAVVVKESGAKVD